MTAAPGSANASVGDSLALNDEPIAARDRIDAERPGVARGVGVRAAGIVAGLVILGMVIALSLLVGAQAIPAGDVWAAILSPADAHAHAVMWELRIPRTLAALVAGAALGVCGALIQAYTRNPLADPGILGVNAGAALAIALGLALLDLDWPAGTSGSPSWAP